MVSFLHLRDKSIDKGHPRLFFFRLASYAFPDIGSVGRSVGRIGKKNKKSPNRRTWYPRMMSFLSFLENAKDLGGTTLNEEKKRMA